MGIRLRFETQPDIQKGELLTLLGPSGCGKTTTMRAIAGLLTPRSGTIVIDGTDVTKVPANKRRWVGVIIRFVSPSFSLEMWPLDFDSENLEW